mmetsp:Transcript_15881/g.29085  ORF Transcript_15881/g.29085 Transcript_15881/m.29085 type:complete len:260 (-) Transcript_15881:197-976(-)
MSCLSIASSAAFWSFCVWTFSINSCLCSFRSSSSFFLISCRYFKFCFTLCCDRFRSSSIWALASTCAFCLVSFLSLCFSSLNFLASSRSFNFFSYSACFNLTKNLCLYSASSISCFLSNSRSCCLSNRLEFHKRRFSSASMSLVLRFSLSVSFLVSAYDIGLDTLLRSMLVRVSFLLCPLPLILASGLKVSREAFRKLTLDSNCKDLKREFLVSHNELFLEYCEALSVGEDPPMLKTSEIWHGWASLDCCNAASVEACE